MHRKHSKFLIVSFIGVLMLGVYSYTHNNMIKTEALTTDSSLSSSLNTTSSTSKEISDKTAEDTAFLMKLASLTKIKIDTSLFTDQSFKLLVNNNIKLESVPYGRTNPFSPTERVTTTNRAAIVLKTSPATSISNKSAILNGSLEGATSNNIYFEYGTTEALGKVTPKVTPSLVGSFASSVIGLSPKTTYFFRASANVNGAMVLGDIISFNTN